MISAGNLSLLSKKGTSSAAWRHFGLRNEGGREAVCKICNKSVPYKGGTTSCLFSHLKNHHPEEYNVVRPRPTSSSAERITKSPLAKAFERSQPYSKTSFRNIEITQAVTRAIALDVMPIYSVEKRGFRDLLGTLDNRYHLPGRDYFSRTAIPELYNRVRGEVQCIVGKADYFAITTDGWSDRQMAPYLSLTVHFIDECFSLQCKCLETMFLPERHTAAQISESLTCMLEGWDLNVAKVCSVTCDNAANMKAAMGLLGWSRISCFGHNLHLAITNSLKDSRVERSVSVARNLVSAFSNSWRRKRDLAAAQIRLDLPEHSLISDCTTRWGSLYLMLQRIIEQMPAIREVLMGDRSASARIPSWQDVDVYKSVCAAMKSLYELTDALSGDKHVTVSAVLPMHSLIRSEMLSSVADTQLTRQIKTKITGYMDTKFDGLPELLIKTATYLDPRFKTYITDIAEIESNLLEEVVSEEGSQVQLPTAATDIAGPPSPAKRRSLGQLLKRHSAPGSTSDSLPRSLREKVKDDLSQYRRVKSLDQESDPLEWWRQQVASGNYDTMKVVVKKYLCSPATSCTSERLFSTAGHVLMPIRSCLSSDKVNQLTFLSKNL